MGDMGDYWREHKAYRKSKGLPARAYRPVPKVRMTKAQKEVGFVACSDWHWQLRINGELLDYWPSKNKWQFRGTISEGHWSELADFIAAMPKEGE